jgi:hypothetical protein
MEAIREQIDTLTERVDLLSSLVLGLIHTDRWRRGKELKPQELYELIDTLRFSNKEDVFANARQFNHFMAG